MSGDYTCLPWARQWPSGSQRATHFGSASHVSRAQKQASEIVRADLGSRHERRNDVKSGRRLSDRGLDGLLRRRQAEPDEHDDRAEQLAGEQIIAQAARDEHTTQGG